MPIFVIGVDFFDNNGSRPQHHCKFFIHRGFGNLLLRAEGRRLFPPPQAIRSIKLYHRQIYKYAYHRPKLAMLRESREHQRFAGVADFLERVPVDCPHELFQGSERASQTPLAKIKTSRLIVVEKENFATRTAGLVIPTVGNNRLRHEALQNFMLANGTTLAIEVPIWLAPETIRELEREHGVALMPEGAAGALTGHIDFLQVRNRAVHILDDAPKGCWRCSSAPLRCAYRPLAAAVDEPGCNLPQGY
jgi:hypothetical protein